MLRQIVWQHVHVVFFWVEIFCLCDRFLGIVNYPIEQSIQKANTLDLSLDGFFKDVWLWFVERSQFLGEVAELRIVRKERIVGATS